MSLRRVGRVAAMLLPTLLCMACGQVYRPVVIPCSTGGIPGCPVETPPTPANFHEVFGISANVPGAPGGALQIDVAGDSIIAETPTFDKSAPNLGDNPTHAAILPNNSRVFVASAGTVFGDTTDALSAFTPASQSTVATGFSTVGNIGLPTQTSSIVSISESGNLVTVTLTTPLQNVATGSAIVIANVAIPGCATSGCNGYDGTFALSSTSGTTIQYMNPAAGLPPSSGGTLSVPPQPVFVATTQPTAVYVANYNSNSVAAVNASTDLVSNTAEVGTHPVALAETPNATKLYVANEGDNSISSLNVADLSPNTVTGFSGTTPVWLAARADSQKVYALTQGDGQLVTIDVATDTVTSSLPVGAGANFVFYDPNLNRLYVTNPTTSMVYVFSDTGGANDTPILLKAISFISGSAACPAGCTPASVTALPDGSRFYVASYQSVAASCPDPLVTGACVVPGLTVFDAQSFALKYPKAPTLALLTSPPFVANLTTNQFQFAVPPVASCVPATLYSPSSTRFRVFTTAAADGSRVYVSMCDAGAIAVINTTDSNINNTGGSGTPSDTVVTDLPVAFSAGSIQANGQPPNQNPIFLLPGQ